MATLVIGGFFVASKVGKTGLADVTLDLWRVALADLTASEVVTAGACTAIGDGLYAYRYAGADLATYQYFGVLKTADATVDAQHVAAMGIVVPDELISSRLATTGYTAPLDAAGTRAAVGMAAANLDTQLAGLPTDQDVRDALKLAPTAGAAAAGSVDAHLDTIIASTGGAGAITWSYTLTSSVDGAAIPDAEVWVTSDAGGVTVLASGRTNASGMVTFQLDAGTVYVWRRKSGYNFTNPDTETVA